MPFILDSRKAIEALVELIRDETGISVEADEVTITEEDAIIRVIVFGEPFTKLDSEDLTGTEDEDAAYLIVEFVRDLRRDLTSARIEYLTKLVGPLLKDVEGELRERLCPINLSFRLEDEGYLVRSRHYMTDGELENDYPDIALYVEAGEGEVDVPVDPYQASEPFDRLELMEKIEAAIRSTG